MGVREDLAGDVAPVRDLTDDPVVGGQPGDRVPDQVLESHHDPHGAWPRAGHRDADAVAALVVQVSGEQRLEVHRVEPGAEAQPDACAQLPADDGGRLGPRDADHRGHLTWGVGRLDGTVGDRDRRGRALPVRVDLADDAAQPRPVARSRVAADLGGAGERLDQVVGQHCIGRQRMSEVLAQATNIDSVISRCRDDSFAVGW